MQSLRANIPPPNWLVTFEAAARCLSFTVAATELNVTRVAVSQQIKALETYLGTPLFQRLHRAIRLTPAGEQYHRAVSSGLQTILAATREARKTHVGNSVTVTTSTGFSMFWLLPRIGDFRRLHPEIELQFLVADNYLNLSTGTVDVAVRYGEGPWPNVTARFLLQEYIYPVCSRAYLQGRKAPQTPADLLGERLLHLQGPYDPETRWRNWFAEHGVDAELP
ncbi:MAG: LysR family transcriptional regulator, partial [Pararhodobacter sp.]|nr:LysR family transcriptional regulator [Pararhodobacter sp.]